MIQFERIRRSSVVRDKIYYLCNHIKFYSVKSPTLTAFYFFTQSLALLSIFTSSSLAAATQASSLVHDISSLFFFYSSDLYASLDASLVPSHALSILLFLVFSVMSWVGWSIDHSNHFLVSKGDLTKIKIMEKLMFLLVTFNIPLGSFIWYYIIRLYEMRLTYLAVLGLLNLLCIFLLVYIVQECSIEPDLKNYQALSRLYTKNQSIHTITKMLVRIIVASFANASNTITVLALTVLLLLDFLELKSSILSKKYLHPTTESLYYYKNVLTVILEVMMIFCLITSFPLFVNNFFFSVLSTSLLAYLALSQFKQHKKLNLVLDDIDSVQTEDDAKIYMLEMISMLENRNSSEQIFKLSLVTIHRQKCKVQTCFCRAFNLQDFGKLLGKGEFLRQFVLSKLQAVVQKFSSSFFVLAILLNYKLTMMSSYSKIYYLLKSFSQRNQMALQSFCQQYMLYQTQMIILKVVRANHISKFVQLETFFSHDQQRGQLTTLIQEVNDYFKEKYKLLGQEICNLNVIDGLCIKISNILRKIQLLWRQFERKDSYSLKMYQLFLIYFQYIVFSRKQVALIKTTISRKTQSLQHLKGISEDNVERYLYTDRSCVIEVMFNKDRTGIITNISQSCKQVFNYNKDDLLDKDFHDLMPQYFASEHRNWSSNWFQNQTLTGKLLKMVNTFFVDRLGICYSCTLHMKVISVGFRLKFYVMLIKDNTSDFIICNKNLQIEGIGSKLINDQIFQLECVKKPISLYADLELSQIEDEIKAGNSMRRRIIFRNETSRNYSQRIIGLAFMGTLSQKSLKLSEAFVYECEVLIQNHNIHGFSYYTFKFGEIKKMVKHNNEFFFKTMNSKNMDYFQALDGVTDPSANHAHIIQAIATFEKNIESQLKLREESSKDKENSNNKFQIHNMSSVAESAVGEGNIIFSKIIEEIKQKSVDYRKVTDKRLSITTVVVLLMVIVVGASSALQSLLFSTGMKSYSQIISATSAVSNNNQLLQIAYNRVITLKQYCSGIEKQARCLYLLSNSQFLVKKIFSLLVRDIQAYLTNTTSLTRIRFFSYYDKSVPLRLQDKEVYVSVKDFLSYFYSEIKNIQINTYINKFPVNLNQSLFILFNNWKTMKLINDQALTYYQTASETEFIYLSMMTYILFTIFTVTLFILMFAIYLYYTYIEEKKEKIIRFHGFLTHSICTKLRQIGQGVNECLANSYEELDVVLQVENLKQNKQKSQFRYEKSRSYIYALAIFFISLGALNTIVLSQTTALFSPAYNMMIQLTSLLRSENAAMEIYLDFKTTYLFNTTTNQSKTYSNIINVLNVTEIPFIANAKNIQNTISTLGGNFANTFRDILIKNVCNLTRSDSNSAQLAKCQTGTHYTILQSLGTAAGVDFILRNLMNSVLTLQSNSNSSFFFTPVYEDIDDSAFYLFKVYQLLQASIVSGMSSIVSGIVSSISTIIIIEISVLIFVLFLWVSRINAEKQRLSDLYAQILQLPQILFRENKLLLKSLEENLTLKL